MHGKKDGDGIIRTREERIEKIKMDNPVGGGMPLGRDYGSGDGC